jgi:hypothetical protein
MPERRRLTGSRADSASIPASGSGLVRIGNAMAIGELGELGFGGLVGDRLAKQPDVTGACFPAL